MRSKRVIGSCLAAFVSNIASAGEGIEHRIIAGPLGEPVADCDGQPDTYDGLAHATIDGDRVLFYNGRFDECAGVFQVPFEGGAIEPLFTSASFEDPPGPIAVPPSESGTIGPPVHVLNAWPVLIDGGAIAFHTLGSSIAIGGVGDVARTVTTFPGADISLDTTGMPAYWDGGLVVPTDFGFEFGDIFGGSLTFVGFQALVHIDLAQPDPTFSVLAQRGTPIDGEMYDSFGTNFFVSELVSQSNNSTPTVAVDGETLYFRARAAGEVRDAIFSLTTGGTPEKVVDRNTTPPEGSPELTGFSSMMDAEDGVLVFVAQTGFPDHQVMMLRDGELSAIADKASVEAALGVSIGLLQFQQVAVSQGRVAIFIGCPGDGTQAAAESAVLVYENGELRCVVKDGDTFTDPALGQVEIDFVRFGSDGFVGDRLVTRPFIMNTNMTALMATTVPFEPCSGDCDRSGTVDFDDLLCAMMRFGGDDPASDCDESGTVDFGDLTCTLFRFGACD